MLSLLIAIGLFEAVGSSCPPLPDNETVWYEYYIYVDSRHTVGAAATKDTSGSFPPGTHARAHWCEPLEKSVSVSYEYYTKGMGMGSITKPDKDGKYPEQTFVRRYCNQLPKNSLAQGRKYGECLASEWKVKNLPDCRFAAGCDEKYLLRKLGFDGISKEESEVLKFPEDKTTKYHQPGSKVTATCYGQPVKLTCADGGHWVTTDSRKALCK